MGVNAGMVEIWSGDERLAVHPRAHGRGQRLTLPSQWDGLVNGEMGRKRQALVVQVSAQQVERRSLDIYECWLAEVCDDRSGAGTRPS